MNQDGPATAIRANTSDATIALLPNLTLMADLQRLRKELKEKDNKRTEKDKELEELTAIVSKEITESSHDVDNSSTTETIK